MKLIIIRLFFFFVVISLKSEIFEAKFLKRNLHLNNSAQKRPTNLTSKRCIFIVAFYHNWLLCFDSKKKNKHYKQNRKDTDIKVSCLLRFDIIVESENENGFVAIQV